MRANWLVIDNLNIGYLLFFDTRFIVFDNYIEKIIISVENCSIYSLWKTVRRAKQNVLYKTWVMLLVFFASFLIWGCSFLKHTFCFHFIVNIMQSNILLCECVSACLCYVLFLQYAYTRYIVNITTIFIETFFYNTKQNFIGEKKIL